MIKLFNRTKIIATTGPASSSYEELLALVRVGVDVFRLNFSHGTHDDHQQLFDHIHKINRVYGLNIGILADLQGPKIRIGKIEDGVIQLNTGDKLQIEVGEFPGTQTKVSTNYYHFAKDVAPGDHVLLDDGKIELKVMQTDLENLVDLEVIHGGPLSSNKGINLPDTAVSIPSLTDKDKVDAIFAFKNHANWIALSFVRSAADVLELIDLLPERNKVKIIAKIEKPQAVDVIDEIIEVTDGIMVARGDLGVEVPLEKMPLIQKDIVRKCILASKPVIIATQIIESMIVSSRPSRAEISDVANAVIDGADALMLSGETSVGQHPTLVIETLCKIIRHVEAQPDIIYNKRLVPRPGSSTFLSDAICYNACKIADEVGAKVIVGMTRSGYTAFLASSYRPTAKIYIFTDNEYLLNILSLSWGVHGFYYDKFVSTDETIADVIDILKNKKLIKQNDIIVNIASMPLYKQGRANMVKVTQVE